LNQATQQLQARKRGCVWISDAFFKSNHRILFPGEVPVAHHVSVLLDAVAQQLSILGVWRYHKAPEKLSNLVLETCLFVFGVLAELTQASKLLHAELLNWSVDLDPVKDELKVILFEVERAVRNDLKDLCFQVTVG
jgi:hypothetical protein